MIASSPTEVLMTRGGKSILFLDVAHGISYEHATQEHRARREGMKLMECAAGHLVTQSQSVMGGACLMIVEPGSISYVARRCFRSLRDWRRVV